MHIGIIGKGAFGSAIAHLLQKNGYTPECIDIGEKFSGTFEVLFLALPTQCIRQALKEQSHAYTTETLLFNCAKGIEKDTGFLPHQIVQDVVSGERYATLGGPSFASEIKADVPTVVNVALTQEEDRSVVEDILEHDSFVVEILGDVFEIELAGAMKNIYAIAAGYVAGSGGKENTRAHMQVVALREYTALVHALEKNNDVVRPCVVGDLILTCASSESRNYQYGLALAQKSTLPDITAEGVHTAEAIVTLSEKVNTALPLALSVLDLVRQVPDAHQKLYRALGFSFSTT